MTPSTHPSPARLDRWDALAAAAAFGLSGALYLRTLATSLLVGDSAEFQVLVSTLGLAHDPGYPIYLLLGKPFTLLPFGDVATRVNLVSAFWASLTLALLYLLGRLFSGRRDAALVGVLALALCDVFWWHAVIAEVYTAGAAFAAFTLLALLLWRRGGHAGWLFAAGLTGGLSLGVHSTVALLVPAVLLFLALTARRGRDWLAAVGGALLGAGLMLAAFVALDAAAAPSGFLNNIRPAVGNWGLSLAQFDQSFWARFDFLFMSRQWQGSMFTVAPLRSLELVGKYFWELLQMFPVGVVGLFLLSLWALFGQRGQPETRSKAECALVGLGWLTMVFFFANYDIGDIETFYIISYVPLMLLVSAGAVALFDGLGWLAGRVGIRAAWVGTLVGLGLVLVTFAPQVHTLSQSWQAGHITFLKGGQAQYPYPVNDAQRPHVDARRIVNQLEDDAILFTDWNRLYPAYYVAHVEQGRTGIWVHETYPCCERGLSKTAMEYIAANIGLRPIYFTQSDPALTTRYRLVTVDASIPLLRLEKK